MIDQEEAQRLVDEHPVWHHTFEIFPGIYTKGSYDPSFLPGPGYLNLPPDLKGLRVIDIGASDGYLSREMDHRGANVLAVDYREKTMSGFSVMEKLYGKSIAHINKNIYDLTADEIGQFDLVFCLGVIYHLPDIPRAIWKLKELLRAGGTMYLETYVEDFNTELPMARYLPNITLGGDISNWWAPNVACVKAMIEDAGFVIETFKTWPERLLISCKADIHEYKYKLAYGRLLHGRIG